MTNIIDIIENTKQISDFFRFSASETICPPPYFTLNSHRIPTKRVWESVSGVPS